MVTRKSDKEDEEKSMNTAVQITPEQEINITRSRFYYLLALGFSFPDEQLRSCRSELQALADTLYPTLKLDALGLDISGKQNDDAELESEYINVFDGIEQKQFCKPYEGQWLEADRAKRQWEVKKFYSYFGLAIDSKTNEMPDSLAMELEFMHFLAYRSASAQSTMDMANKAEKDPNQADHYLRAQRDFMARHLSQWIPNFCGKLHEKTSTQFYLQLAQLTDKFIADDLEWLKENVQSTESQAH